MHDNIKNYAKSKYIDEHTIADSLTNKKAQFLKKSSIRHMYYQYVLFYFFLDVACPGPPRCLTASRQRPPRWRRRARVWPGHPLAHRHAATGRRYQLHCREGL